MTTKKFKSNKTTNIKDREHITGDIQLIVAWEMWQ